MLVLTTNESSREDGRIKQKWKSAGSTHDLWSAVRSVLLILETNQTASDLNNPVDGGR
jgi:hypothetical protein